MQKCEKVNDFDDGGEQGLEPSAQVNKNKRPTSPNGHLGNRDSTH